jgi:hypothetical protein
MKNNKTKIIAVRLPVSIYKELKKWADAETEQSLLKTGLKTSVSKKVREIIIQNIITKNKKKGGKNE